MSVFLFTLTARGVAVPMSTYQGEVTLIVNLASRCSFAASNNALLNNLQRTYTDRGFTVLGCPCGNFGAQEPLSNSELDVWQRDMGILFPVFDKLDVKGKRRDPLFAMLQEQLGEVRWNYTKFLCDRAGTPVKRFDAGCPPPMITESIEALL